MITMFDELSSGQAAINLKAMIFPCRGEKYVP
jgi:hypothetical protein